MREALPRLAALAVAFSISLGSARAEELLLVYAGPGEGSVLYGVQQGQAEANILGRFTGQTYRLETVAPGKAIEELRRTTPLAVLAAVDAATLPTLAEQLQPRGVTVFNLTAEDDSLRRKCSVNLLHVIPSARMRNDAVAQWRKKQGNGAADVQALAWHGDFVKFAGRELNNRYREAHGRPMDDAAWAGWAAVKMLSEAVARSQSTEPPALLAYLREEMEFDGQKGAPHTFRDTGQLRQPLLIVEAGKLVAEAPVRGVADPDDLDSLGLPSCKTDPSSGP